jgi:hypothetical protein
VPRRGNKGLSSTPKLTVDLLLSVGKKPRQQGRCLVCKEAVDGRSPRCNEVGCQWGVHATCCDALSLCEQGRVFDLPNGGKVISCVEHVESTAQKLEMGGGFDGSPMSNRQLFDLEEEYTGGDQGDDRLYGTTGSDHLIAREGEREGDPSGDSKEEPLEDGRAKKR